MNEWLIQQGITTVAAGWWAGLMAGLLAGLLLAWYVSRRQLSRERSRFEQLESSSRTQQESLHAELAELRLRESTAAARSEERERAHAAQLQQLSEAEKRLGEQFERLAGRIFEERSARLSDLNQKQLEPLLQPLKESMLEFRNVVTETHKQETAQHHVLQEKLRQLEQLNDRLHDDATHLTRALTTNVKAQGSWGEQQLERLLELAGLQKGQDYSTQFSVVMENGQRVQPDLVVHLPEAKSVVLDSKVSLLAWTRYQAAEDDSQREQAMKQHVQSLRQHIRNLGEKRYSELPGLDALDFVLMFVPVEGALIAALQADGELPGFALQHRIALVSPTNFLATMRTVASVWAVHRQNRNAHDIARRAGLLYDKFSGFVDNLQKVGDRLRQAQLSYDDALGQLATGSGNLVRQAEMLRELGARVTRPLEPPLVEKALSSPNSGDFLASAETGAQSTENEEDSHEEDSLLSDGEANKID